MKDSFCVSWLSKHLKQRGIQNRSSYFGKRPRRYDENNSNARIIGVESQMKTFNYLFSVLLADRILTPIENLSKSLQRTDISAEEGQFLCELAVKTFESERNIESFFWENCLTYIKSDSNDIQEPLVPRAKKRPRRYDENNSSAHFHQDAKDHYRQRYFEALDTVRNCIKDRFDQ